MKFPELEYKRPDIELVKKEYSNLTASFRSAESFEQQSEILYKINELRNDFRTHESIASVRHSINTEDEQYEKEQNYFDEIMPHYEDLENNFYRAINASPHKARLIDKFGDQLFTIAELMVKTFEPEIIDDLTKENRLSTEYTNLIASAKIEFNGEVYNLSGIEPFTQSTDREVRRKASEAKFKFLADNKEKLDELFDKLVKTRHRIAQKLGYNNFVELGYKRMLRSDYNMEMVAKFRENIQKHIVPICVKLREAQEKRLGLDKLMYYDLPLAFKNGNPKPKGEPDWIIENGMKMYSELSEETREFFSFMREHEMMDLVNKKGKAAGGYCTFINNYKSPFIFSNFNGTSHDIDVLTHEAGHAFQVYSSRNLEVQEYHWPTYEACEIHSMSMEFFTWPWMHLFFKEETDKYKFDHLAGSLLFLPYGATVDEFQHEVYLNPDMTPDERNAKWRELEKKYTPSKNYEGNEYLENGGYWQRQLHIYSTPFYYIDYTLAQICAFQFWLKMKDDYKTAWQDYLTLCEAGGSRSFLELVKLAKLESPFKEGIVERLANEIRNELNQIKV
ncbi:MAG: M3 family oligoendopeptidase [Chitinophagales bacterium]|nr:M3 family oligoendopeptidase [Chitinophagales bacterium]